MKDALQAILVGPAAHDAPTNHKRPILLVIDSLERILETPVAGQQRANVQHALRDTLRSVICAFDSVRGQTKSRLILASRYMLTLPDGEGGDLADRLFELQMPPLSERQRNKLLDMEARQGSRFAALNAELAERIDHLLERVTVAAGGNPGLHALLNRLTRQHASLHLADAAIAEVERYHLVHALPEQGEVGEFFRQLGLVTYLRALTSDELAQMRAALVFYPAQVPWAVMEAVGHAAGVDQPAAAMKRLLGLGCLDAFHSPGQAARDAPPKVAVNALAKPLYPPLTAAEDAHLDVKGALDAWYRQLPAFGTGHEHERTKGLGEIADFLFTRGELDDALQLQVEERLPLVLCLEDPIATCEIHLSCAAIRIAQGRMNEAMSHQATQDGLAAAIDLAKKLGYIHVASIVKVVKLLEQPAMAGTAVSYLHNAARHFRALESPRGRSGAAMSADSVRSTK